ncbi:hypothetical protein EG835_08970, partial [bacterium]|nr:hypothetical protein [bacterium]
SSPPPTSSAGRPPTARRARRPAARRARRPRCRRRSAGVSRGARRRKGRARREAERRAGREDASGPPGGMVRERRSRAGRSAGGEATGPLSPVSIPNARSDFVRLETYTAQVGWTGLSNEERGIDPRS